MRKGDLNVMLIFMEWMWYSDYFDIPRQWLNMLSNWKKDVTSVNILKESRCGGRRQRALFFCEDYQYTRCTWRARQCNMYRYLYRIDCDVKVWSNQNIKLIVNDWKNICASQVTLAWLLNRRAHELEPVRFQSSKQAMCKTRTSTNRITEVVLQR